MNKEQYIQELTKSLASLPEQDREDAISYYDEYLSDMAENNPEKIETLDDPGTVAAQIKAEAAMKGTEVSNVKKKKGISAAWAVLLGVLALPIGLPVAISVAVIALALIIVALAVVISLFASALAVVVSGIASLISGFVVLFTTTPVGLFHIGAGLLCLGLGYLISVGVYILSKKIFAWIARLINNIRLKIQNRQNKKREVA